MRILQVVFVSILILISLLVIVIGIHGKIEDPSSDDAAFIFTGFLSSLLGLSSLIMNIKFLRGEHNRTTDSDQLIDYDFTKNEKSKMVRVPTYLKVGNALFAVCVILMLFMILKDGNIDLEKEPIYLKIFGWTIIASLSYVAGFICIGGIVRFIKTR